MKQQGFGAEFDDVDRRRGTLECRTISTRSRICSWKRVEEIVGKNSISMVRVYLR